MEARWPLRGRAADAAIAACMAAVVIVTTMLAPQGRLEFKPAHGLSWLMILLACGALYFRRDHPVAIAVFTFVVCAVYYMTAEPDGPIVMAFVIALYTVAAERHLAVAIVLGTAAAGGVALGEFGSEIDHLSDAGLFLLTGWFVAVVAMGGVTRNRRAYLREAERRAHDAERRMEEEARRRTAEERLRIAREVHDVIGHNVSLINVQASAALHRLAAAPDPAGTEAEAALSAIKQTSKDALRELRVTVGVLRAEDEEAPTAPAPGLGQVDALTERATSAGLAVRTEIDGVRGTVPPEVDLAAYRILQEALTNVTRHAGATTAVVRIRYGDDALCLDVDDDGRAGGAGTSPGNGIRGMRERAEALGGELSAGGRPDGGFRVSARLPLA